jgi:hypothetical protein
MVLAASRLESNLRIYLNAHGENVPEGKATLGLLTKKLLEHGLLSKNGEIHFNTLKTQRNYLAHKLYDLFSERIEETILPRTDLVDLDVELFTERAAGLSEDLNFFASLVQKRLLEQTKLLQVDMVKPSHLV